LIVGWLRLVGHGRVTSKATRVSQASQRHISKGSYDHTGTNSNTEIPTARRFAAGRPETGKTREPDPTAYARAEANRKAYRSKAGRGKANLVAQRSTRKLRLEVYEAYGGAACSCCQETEYVFLTLDHIDSNGAADRKVYKTANGLLRALRAQGYPSGYRVLCFNCNCGRSRNGGVCPHEQKT